MRANASRLIFAQVNTTSVYLKGTRIDAISSSGSTGQIFDTDGMKVYDFDILKITCSIYFAVDCFLFHW